MFPYFPAISLHNDGMASTTGIIPRKHFMLSMHCTQEAVYTDAVTPSEATGCNDCYSARSGENRPALRIVHVVRSLTADLRAY